MTQRVLIIDNEVSIVENLRHTLELDGHEVHSEAEVQWGVIEARTFGPNLVITSLEKAQDHHGRLLPQLREDHSKLPVLILGTRPEDGENLPGFRLGIDDYLLRPAALSELHRRIDALLQQADNGPSGPSLTAGASSVITYGDIEIRPAARIVQRAGRPVVLRLKEFELLMALVSRDGAVATRHELLRNVWGFRTRVATRTVDNHIGDLRAKLEEHPASPRHILTVHKVGYRLQR